MTNPPSPPALSREDYAVIEAAVMETARGRWFLAEYARRNRNADTTVLLEAIARLERSLPRPDAARVDMELRRELVDMASSIHRTKTDLAHSIAEATGELRAPAPDRAFEDIVDLAAKAGEATARATGHVHDMAAALKAGAPAGAVAGGLERQGLELSRASEQHALTTERVRSIVAVLREMEERLRTIVGGWTEDGEPAGAPLRTPPAPRSEDRALRRRPVDERESALAATPGARPDDLVFVDTSRWRERRAAPEPTPLHPVEGSAPAAAPAAPPAPALSPPPPHRIIDDRPGATLLEGAADRVTMVEDVAASDAARSPFDSLEIPP